MLTCIFYNVILLFQFIKCFSNNQINMLNKNSIVGNNKNVNPLKVSIIGSGNWGTVISKIVALNTQKINIFHPQVKMYVKEEIVYNEKLTDIINIKRENIKYMKGMKLPDNIIASSDINEVVKVADLLIFVVPHQYLNSVLNEIKKTSNVKKNAKAISLIKGINLSNNIPELLSNVIQKELNIECSVLSGSNIAKEIANACFSESTLGFENAETVEIWHQLFDTTYFKINCIQDKAGVEICGTLKNIVALGVGFCDMLCSSYNTKSAIIRIGLEEIKNFAKKFFPSVLDETFFDSCGIADLIATCLGGRNYKCAKEFATSRGSKTWEQIEKDLLNGQKLQGTHTVKDVYNILEHHGLKKDFPLFCIIYEISFENRNPLDLIRIFSTTKLRSIKFNNKIM